MASSKETQGDQGDTTYTSVLVAEGVLQRRQGASPLSNLRHQQFRVQLLEWTFQPLWQHSPPGLGKNWERSVVGGRVSHFHTVLRHMMVTYIIARIIKLGKKPQPQMLFRLLLLKSGNGLLHLSNSYFVCQLVLVLKFCIENPNPAVKDRLRQSRCRCPEPPIRSELLLHITEGPGLRSGGVIGRRREWAHRAGSSQWIA